MLQNFHMRLIQISMVTEFFLFHNWIAHAENKLYANIEQISTWEVFRSICP